MVDVGAKDETHRVAVAEGRIEMRPETLRLIREGEHEKGDVLGIARIAAIQAAKRTAELIPLCHPVPSPGSKWTSRPRAGVETEPGTRMRTRTRYAAGPGRRRWGGPGWR